MYQPIIRINEIRNLLIRFRVVETALDAVIIFLSLFLIFSYTGVDSMWALFLLPLLFFAIAFKFRYNVNMIWFIEERYPALRERLGALYDNREETNAVVEDLAASVDSDLDGVKYSMFISTWRLGVRTAVILLLVTFVLSSSFFHSPNISAQPESPDRVSLPESMGAGSSSPISTSDIFEEPSVVKIGDDSQGILIYRSQGSEPNVRGTVKPASGYSKLFPPEATSSETYSEAVPSKYQLIVKNYFTNLSLQD